MLLHTLSRMAKIKNKDNTEYEKNVEQLEFSYLGGGNTDVTVLESTLVVSTKRKYMN